MLVFCAGYGSLPKNTKRKFKLFPFFQKAFSSIKKKITLSKSLQSNPINEI